MRTALKIIMDEAGIALSRRRITLSTTGIIPQMQACGEELAVNLAVSLHAVTDALRDELVPINRNYPIAEVLAACRAYPRATNARRITFEYGMLKGVNDSQADAEALVKLIAGIPAKVNLIPFNPWPGSLYETSDAATIEAFARVVMHAGYASPVRKPRGRAARAAAQRSSNSPSPWALGSSAPWRRTSRCPTPPPWSAASRRRGPCSSRRSPPVHRRP